MFDEFRIGFAMLELKYGVKHGSHRFWLFVLNWVVSLFLFVWFGWQLAGWQQNAWIVVPFIIVASGVFVWVDIIKIWNNKVAKIK